VIHYFLPKRPLGRSQRTRINIRYITKDLALGSQKVIASDSPIPIIKPEINNPGIEPNPASARMHQLSNPNRNPPGLE